MDLPDQCFCGCGIRTSKMNPANLEGYSVALELGHWLGFVSVMKRAGPDRDWSEADRFMADGAAVYRLLLEEVHSGVKTDRKTRKQARRWLKFSRKSREKISDGTPPEAPDPFGWMPRADQVREWVFEGTLLPVDE
jgi:hypothetical protein